MVATGLAWLVAGSTGATAAERPRSAVTWTACPTYSDDVLRALNFTDAQLPQVHALLGRMECGTVGVPLDYQNPGGRQITVAVTRLKAVDPAHRLGSLALNPGGPGGSGYLMPVTVVTMNESAARLNDRYDLIGFDPRGVGYSTKVNCPPPAMPPEGPPVGPLTEQEARQIYDWEVDNNAACGRSDPEFLGQLTTSNVARDLDRARAALGEDTLSFLGVSWGTWLGAIYRGIFPTNVGRMFLDSVLPPQFHKATLDDDQIASIERGFARMAAWIAQHNDTYGFGTTPEQVRAAIIALRTDYDENPRTFTDLPRPVDGSFVAQAASQPSPYWSVSAQALKELRDATGPTAPPTVKDLLGGPQTPPPAGTPERQNPTMANATICNDDTDRPDFSTSWAAYQQRVAHNPVTGRMVVFSANCAGWPLPGHDTQLRRTGASLVLSGHRYETITPYEWAAQAHAAIGGTLFTVDDDVHGSALRVPGCAAKLVSYFNTGRIDRGCAGTPVQPASRASSTAAPVHLSAADPLS